MHVASFDLNSLCSFQRVTWRKIKDEAFEFFVLFDCVLVYSLIQKRAGQLWWLKEIEFHSAWLITLSNRGERASVHWRFTAGWKLPVCSGDSLSVGDSSPTLKIRFVSSYFHSFGAGRLFHCTWIYPPFPLLGWTYPRLGGSVCMCLAYGLQIHHWSLGWVENLQYCKACASHLQYCILTYLLCSEISQILHVCVHDDRWFF